MGEDREFYGSASMSDGTRVALTSEQAKALWQRAEEAKAQRAETMPTAQDALRALIAAEERLRELGWSRGGSLRVKRGDYCAVAEQGSTGIWKGWLDQDGAYVHYGDCASSRQKVFLKPLADLTEDERKHMEACDQREVEAYRSMIANMQRAQP